MSPGHRARQYARYRTRGRYLCRIARRHFPADREARILDLGCGSGALLHFLREAGYRQLRGVDSSAEQAEAGDLAEELARVPAGSLDVVVPGDPSARAIFSQNLTAVRHRE